MKKNVYILLLPHVHIFDLACPLQVLYEANYFGLPKFQIQYIGLTQHIKTQQALTLSEILPLQQVTLRPADVLCIPGINFDAMESGLLDDSIEALKPFVKDHWQSGGTILSVCTASLVLCKMGLLDYKKCSTHWKCFDYLKAHFPKTKLQEEHLFSVDQNIYTSAGMTAGIDMTLAYLENEYNPLLAANVAQEMVINIRRENIGVQKNVFLDFQNKFHPVVYKVQQMIENRMHESLSITEIATEMNMSERNLGRLFKKHTGMSITDYKNKIKIKEAEKLLLYSDCSIKEIAHSLGYGSEPYFIRVWKKAHELTPGHFRKAHLDTQPTE